MLPKVIIHNEISLDGSIKGFNADVGTYYKIAISYKPDIILVGSVTARSGVNRIPPEEKIHFKKPKIKRGDRRPYWVIPDSRGILKGVLHVFRGFDYCKDVIILISSKTPSSYLKYLEQREYDYIVCGKDHIDYKEALGILAERYNSKTVLTDSGGKLNNILLEQGLVSEISVIISPVLVGSKGIDLFRDLNLPYELKLKLLRNEVIDNNCLLLVYRVIKK
jgi:2,5-diamino-6-(ribosylamino)-4(3H)-pyrimidinone 5'-phosphate reductase